jgi:methionyl-tRNA synthetase
MTRTFYVSTPIYYVNDIPHIGHAYTTIAADVIARYMKLKGKDVFFLTGTDEHGQKVEKSATAQGLTPKELADRVVTRFRDLWKELSISNSDFIRTSEERHHHSVQTIFKAAFDKGDIYLSEYEDWYCTPCESFWTEMQLEGGICPDCKRPVEKLKEESYFFRLSKYGEPLLRHYQDNPGFIKPESRKNEIISFVSEGLKDLSVSRTSFSWGIPVPVNDGHVIYVWFDALTNYITGVGFPEDTEKFQKYWPANVHLIGKDILRFHTVYWPAFLMSAGLELPRGVFAHGWWTVEGQKMSKSLGNVIDPYEVADRYGVDQFRYFLLREVPFGLDGDFSHTAMVHRINSDLANDFGNLLNRTLNMVNRYFDGIVPSPVDEEELERELLRYLGKKIEEIDAHMNDLSFHKALINLWEIIGKTNKYIDSTAPWSLAKQEGMRERLSTVLYTVLETIRIVTLLLWPFIPSSSEKIWNILGQVGTPGEARLPGAASFGILEGGTSLPGQAIIFPRIE